MRKLELWCAKVSSSKLNFEWPTRELLQQQDEGVYLQSIKFKSNSSGYLTSVQCNLSNGLSSPTFEQEGLAANYHQHLRTIELNRNRALRQVKAYDNNGEWPYLHDLRFLDSSGNVVHSYDPTNKNYAESSVREIGENEEIIGVYGVKGDNYKWFRNFGFIVKVRLQ